MSLRPSSQSDNKPRYLARRRADSHAMNGELDNLEGMLLFVSTCTSTIKISLAKEAASAHMPDSMKIRRYRVQHHGDRHARFEISVWRYRQNVLGVVVACEHVYRNCVCQVVITRKSNAVMLLLQHLRVWVNITLWWSTTTSVVMARNHDFQICTRMMSFCCHQATISSRTCRTKSSTWS
jgi:hypothetical protein